GSGVVDLVGGELIGTATETLSSVLDFDDFSSRPVTIAAAAGTPLDEDAISYTVRPNTTLDIGSPSEDGTILWHTNDAVGNFLTVDVQAGTLKAADDQFFSLTQGQTTVDAGATLDVAGSTAPSPTSRA